MQLFGRQARLSIAKAGKPTGLSFDDFRITFKVVKQAVSAPNSCELKIYNLNDEHMANVGHKDDLIFLSAGYRDDVGPIQLYAGDILNSSPVHETPDSFLKIESKECHSFLSNFQINVSFEEGTLASVVLKALIKHFVENGIAVRFLATVRNDRQYATGFSHRGRINDAFTLVCDYCGLSWSTVDRELVVLNDDQSLATSHIEIGPTSGLISAVERTENVKGMRKKKGAAKANAMPLTVNAQCGANPATSSMTIFSQMKGLINSGATKSTTDTISGDKLKTGKKSKAEPKIPGWTFKCLLNPSIQPKSKIVLISKTFPHPSIFTVAYVEHVGDTHGPDWYSKVEVY